MIQELSEVGVPIRSIPSVRTLKQTGPLQSPKSVAQSQSQTGEVRASASALETVIFHPVLAWLCGESSPLPPTTRCCVWIPEGCFWAAWLTVASKGPRVELADPQYTTRAPQFSPAVSWLRSVWGLLLFTHFPHQPQSHSPCQTGMT